MTCSAISRHRREVSSTLDLSMETIFLRRCMASRPATRVMRSISLAE